MNDPDHSVRDSMLRRFKHANMVFIIAILFFMSSSTGKHALAIVPCSRVSTYDGLITATSLHRSDV